MTFGERLRAARKAAGLSAAELARRTRCHPTVLSHFERDVREPALTNLVKLCDALNISADYLLGRGESRSLDRRISDLESKVRELDERTVGQILIGGRP